MSTRAARRLDVVEEHFEELSILWEQREAFVADPELTRSDLQAYEARAEAHRDALFLAQQDGVQLALAALSSDDAPALTAAAFVLLDHGDDAHVQPLVNALESASVEARDGLRLGLRHSPLSGLREPLIAMAASENLGLALLASDVLTFQQAAYGWPVALSGPAPERLLQCEDARERAVAHGILGRLGVRPDSLELEGWVCSDVDTAEPRAALERALRTRQPGLDQLCRRLAGRSDAALAFLGVVGALPDVEGLTAACAETARAPAALAALGALGAVAGVDTLIAHTRDEATLEGAVAALRRVLGHEPDRLSPGELPPIREAELDEEFEPSPLPVDQAALEAYWARTRPTLDAGQRYQAGSPVPARPEASWLDGLPLDARRDWALVAGIAPELPVTPLPSVRVMR